MSFRFGNLDCCIKGLLLSFFPLSTFFFSALHFLFFRSPLSFFPQKRKFAKKKLSAAFLTGLPAAASSARNARRKSFKLSLRSNLLLSLRLNSRCLGSLNSLRFACCCATFHTIAAFCCFQRRFACCPLAVIAGLIRNLLTLASNTPLRWLLRFAQVFCDEMYLASRSSSPSTAKKSKEGGFL